MQISELAGGLTRVKALLGKNHGVPCPVFGEAHRLIEPGNDQDCWNDAIDETLRCFNCRKFCRVRERIFLEAEERILQGWSNMDEKELIVDALDEPRHTLSAYQMLMDEVSNWESRKMLELQTGYDDPEQKIQELQAYKQILTYRLNSLNEEANLGFAKADAEYERELKKNQQSLEYLLATKTLFEENLRSLQK